MCASSTGNAPASTATTSASLISSKKKTLFALSLPLHCSNCGGSVNLQTSSACPFCHSPISILDLQEQQGMLAQLKEAAASGGKQVDPALPLKLAMAKAEASDYFSISRHSDWWADPGTTRDLVVGALKDIARLFTGRIS